jgi:hypothetical protein
MVVPLTPKSTRKAEALAKAPPTIASRRMLLFTLNKKVPFCQHSAFAQCLLPVLQRPEPSLFFLGPFFLKAQADSADIAMAKADI